MFLASILVFAITVAIVGCSLFLIGLVLLQKNRGSGLSGAFGGVGGNTAFGTKTGDVLTWVTVGVTAAFLLLCVIGNFVMRPEYSVPVNTAAPVNNAPAGTPSRSNPVTPVTNTPNVPANGNAATPPAATPDAGEQPAATPATGSEQPSGTPDESPESPDGN